MEGPDVLLSAEATQPIAIVLHELVTNASKYGALSMPHGHITVRWDCQKGDHCRGKAGVGMDRDRRSHCYRSEPDQVTAPAQSAISFPMSLVAQSNSSSMQRACAAE